jgi:hypothetical protein
MTSTTRIAAVAALVAACDPITDSFDVNDFSGDQYPVDVELTSGAIVIGVRTSDSPDLIAVLDILSPVSVVDPGPEANPSVNDTDLTLLGRRPTGTLDLPRARFLGAQVLSVHPCVEDTCIVGPGDVPRPVEAIIGANALAGDAVRLRTGDSQLFVFPDIGGQDRDRSYACDAVFPSPYRGGGTLVIAGTELSFGGRRVTLQTCAGYDPAEAQVQGRRGADMLLVASTSIGRTLLGASAYERYRSAVPCAPALASLPDAVVFLPSGRVAGKATTIPRLALVASSSSAPHAPCRQVYAHHLLTRRDCAQGDDCPCDDPNADTRFCAVPAILEFEPVGGIDVLVIDDSDPTLQALRTELRPDQPEVDGILGTHAIRDAEIDIDYPHDRVLARCAHASAACSTRPALPERDDRDQVNGCLPAVIEPAPLCPVIPRAR